MARNHEDIRRDLDAAETATRHFQSWTLEFQAACIRGDLGAVEKARLRVIGSLEAQLDALAAAFMRTVG
jgi:hypothetical protein